MKTFVLACVLVLCASTASAQRPYCRPIYPPVTYPAYRPIVPYTPPVVYPTYQPLYPYMPPVTYPAYRQPPSYGYQSSWWWNW